MFALLPYHPPSMMIIRLASDSGRGPALAFCLLPSWKDKWTRLIFIYYSATRAHTARENVRDEGGDGGGGDTLVYGYKVGQMLTMRTAKLKRPITPHRATTPPLPGCGGQVEPLQTIIISPQPVRCVRVRGVMVDTTPLLFLHRR